MQLSVFHVGMTVSDLDSAVTFFTSVLEMEVVHTQVQDNPYSRALVGEPDARFRVVQLRFLEGPPPPSNHVLELIAYDAPRLEPLVLRNPQAGAMHLAILVPEIDPVLNRAREHGATPLSEPVDITAGINAGGRACYLRGPDGITLELLQRPSAR
jgi:lactoylglutathione lyase